MLVGILLQRKSAALVSRLSAAPLAPPRCLPIPSSRLRRLYIELRASCSAILKSQSAVLVSRLSAALLAPPWCSWGSSPIHWGVAATLPLVEWNGAPRERIAVTRDAFDRVITGDCFPRSFSLTAQAYYWVVRLHGRSSNRTVAPEPAAVTCVAHVLETRLQSPLPKFPGGK